MVTWIICELIDNPPAPPVPGGIIIIKWDPDMTLPRTLEGAVRQARTFVPRKHNGVAICYFDSAYEDEEGVPCCREDILRAGRTRYQVRRYING